MFSQGGESPFLKPSTHSAAIIDGAAIAKQIRTSVAQEVKEIKEKCGRVPGLTVVLVGDNPASKAYVGSKGKAAREVGIVDKTINLPSTVSESELLGIVDELNKDHSVDGVLVQLPLPDHLPTDLVCDSVIPSKDVDGFSVTNLGKLYANSVGHVPATARGVRDMVQMCGFETLGKHVCVVGASRHVGGPIGKIFSEGGFNSTVTITHKDTPNDMLVECVKMADILVVCAGKPALITKEMVKPGVIVVDVGINRITLSNGKTKLVGDVDFEGVSQVAKAITPVPGGVGLLTVAGLLLNTLDAAKLHLGLR